MFRPHVATSIRNVLDISTAVLKDTRRDHTKVVCPNTAQLPDETEPYHDNHREAVQARRTKVTRAAELDIM